MVYVVWINIDARSPYSDFPRLKDARIVSLDDTIREVGTRLIEGNATNWATDEEVRRDWEAVFATLFDEATDAGGRKILIFPHSGQKSHFFYMKSVCGFADSGATHSGTLGSLLTTEGARPNAEDGIPKLIGLIREQGVDSLIEQGFIRETGNTRSVREGILSNRGYQYFGDAEMDIVSRAIIFAAKAHSGATRKGTNLPYLLHPVEAAAIAASVTDDKEVIASAALHDVLEDTEVNAAQLQIEFGARVRKLVESESENKRPGLPASETWKARKSETIDYLQSVATEDERIIALADKLSNIRACLRDYEEVGDAMWEKFNMPDKEMQAWYYSSVRNALGRLQNTAAWQEFNHLVDRLFPK
jgi:myo-inositol-1(or 4)-monophosphatase